MVICDHELRPHRTANFTNKCCVCSNWSVDWPFPRLSLPLLGPPYSLRHTNIEVRPITNPIVGSKCSSERGELHDYSW